MTAQEYLATIKRPLTDIERNCAIEAWDSAKKDCQKDIEGWTASAYEDGALSMEANTQRIFDSWVREGEKVYKFRNALMEIHRLTVSRDDPIASIREIKSIVERTVD